eukprot:TRINITY_DN18628_c0_g1_i1.p1 TRINITY_DN18628_c0_g1~~TRINITY_DN18628_c0_g1_i1.p1  ORF type:complete len:109 (+),score=8.94 TRINITY_DN18628_c0_g1_i1:551-877(+)
MMEGSYPLPIGWLKEETHIRSSKGNTDREITYISPSMLWETPSRITEARIALGGYIQYKVFFHSYNHFSIYTRTSIHIYYRSFSCKRRNRDGGYRRNILLRKKEGSHA